MASIRSRSCSCMLLSLAVLVRRATAPFLNEIVLLEKNPLRSRPIRTR